MHRLGMSVVLVAASSVSAFAAQSCPAKSLSYDDIIAKISAAPSCSSAYDVMGACLFVASGDVGLADAVMKKCEPAFIDKLSKQQHRAYMAAGAQCIAKYAHEEGTMYVSFSATCQAHLARDYAYKYGGKDQKPGVRP